MRVDNRCCRPRIVAVEPLAVVQVELGPLPRAQHPGDLGTEQPRRARPGVEGPHGVHRCSGRSRPARRGWSEKRGSTRSRSARTIRRWSGRPCRCEWCWCAAGPRCCRDPPYRPRHAGPTPRRRDSSRPVEQRSPDAGAPADAPETHRLTLLLDLVAVDRMLQEVGEVLEQVEPPLQGIRGEAGRSRPARLQPVERQAVAGSAAGVGRVDGAEARQAPRVSTARRGIWSVEFQSAAYPMPVMENPFCTSPWL